MAESQLSLVPLQDVTFSLFTAVYYLLLIILNVYKMTEFLYTDALNLKDPSDSVEILTISHQWSQDDLKKLCEICIRTFIELDDIATNDSVAEQAINAFQGKFLLIFFRLMANLCQICFILKRSIVFVNN